MSFVDSFVYSRGINFKFNEKMKNQKVRAKIFSTTATNTSLYSDWTFGGKGDFTKFYDGPWNLYLLNTAWFKLGSNGLESTKFDINIQESIEVGIGTNKTILGLPIEFKDRTNTSVIFKPATQSIDDTGKLKLTTQKNKFDVIMMFNINFIKDLKVINYFGYSDFISKVGGYKSAAAPLLTLFVPIAMLMFLNNLSGILGEN